MTESNEAIAEKLNIAWRFFSSHGYVDGFGHLSARTEDPNKVLITPHSLRPDSQPEDFVLIDLDGNRYGHDARLPGELPIHLEIYKNRPDVGSVSHFHCAHSTAFSMSEHDLMPTYFLASIFHDGIPVHPDARLVQTQERGVALAKTLGSHRAALMRAHGIVVTGPDVIEMTAGVFIMEDNAKRTAIAASMGKFETLGTAEMEEISGEILAGRNPIMRIWTLCKEAVEALDT
jgi:ribulose-5-phosphate 4-epimerase/fuculose-1-phosphate aldolase